MESFFDGRKYFSTYLCFGWLTASLPVVCWALIIFHNQNFEIDNLCFDTHVDQVTSWIIEAPMNISTCVNFILFINILSILLGKIREDAKQTGRIGNLKSGTVIYTLPKNSISLNSKQLMKMAKAILLLIPLFGVTDLMLDVIWPENMLEYGVSGVVCYGVFDFIRAMQGCVISVVYFFCNTVWVNLNQVYYLNI